MTRSVTLRSGETIRIPEDLPIKGWQIDSKGYVGFTSRRKSVAIKRGARAHRVVMEILAGRSLRQDEHVHHQDGVKKNNCGCNLVLLPAAFNPSNARRDPYTGAFMSAGEWERRYA